MGSFYILCAILIWSSLGVFIRLVPLPLHVIIFYSALTSVVLSGTLMLFSNGRELYPGKRGMLYLSVIGPLSLLNIFTFLYAYRHTTIANAVLTHYIAPVLVAFMAPVFLKEKITRRIVFAIALAMLGLYIMVGADIGSLLSYLEHPTEDAAGIFSGLFSGFVYAVIIIMFRVYSQNFSPLVLTFAQNLLIALILLPFVREVPLQYLGWLIPMGIFNSTLAPLLYFKGFKRVQANRAAVLGYLEPVGAIVFSIIFLLEYPPLRSVFGGVLILMAGYFTLKAE